MAVTTTTKLDSGAFNIGHHISIPKLIQINVGNILHRKAFKPSLIRDKEYKIK